MAVRKLKNKGMPQKAGKGPVVVMFPGTDNIEELIAEWMQENPGYQEEAGTRRDGRKLSKPYWAVGFRDGPKKYVSKRR
jgi:hypothetical protein